MTPLTLHLTVKVRLINRETLEIKEQDKGDSLMTKRHSYNGAGESYRNTARKISRNRILSLILTSRMLYSSTIIPNRGAWLEYETDSVGVLYVRAIE